MSHHVLLYRLFDPDLVGRDDAGSFDENSIRSEVESGHTYHCAARVVWGDGECECGLLEREEIAASISYQDPVALAPSYAEHYGSDIWNADQGRHFE